MFTRVFVDFDNTIYDTQRLREDIVRVLEKHGVPAKVVWETFDPAIHGPSGAYYNYTLEEHLELIEKAGYDLSKTAVLEQLYGLLEEKRTMAGAEEFLTSVRQQTEMMILLTAGNEKFQQKKITASGLEIYFDTTKVVNEKKEEYVGTVHQIGDIDLFVNDSLKQNVIVKKQFPDITVVTMVHPKDTKEQLEATKLPYFYTLKDVREYVRTKLS